MALRSITVLVIREPRTYWKVQKRPVSIRRALVHLRRHACPTLQKIGIGNGGGARLGLRRFDVVESMYVIKTKRCLIHGP